MGYPAATGRGTSRTDATCARDLEPTVCRSRDSCSSRSTGMGRLFFPRVVNPMAQRGNWGKRGVAGSETRGGVRWPPREKTDRPRRQRFHRCATFTANHARVVAAPIRGPV